MSEKKADALHTEAERLRAMPDKQLVEEFHRSRDAEMPARVPRMSSDVSEEAQAGKSRSDVGKLLYALSEGKCKGVKGATVYKITKFAKEMGLV